ncbi:MAG: penicillin-binding protein 2 [Zoogloeaceae bacterium]|jgi:cell division protein FtsI (penicillin-binding protein 3)|nr:penicillin-binding protein 2 [Zoogloeaceae bacterium]
MAIRRRGAKPRRFADNPLLELALHSWRSRFVNAAFLALFLLLLGKAFYLQVIDNDFLQTKGDSRYRRDLKVPASRGKITDRNGELLAGSVLAKSVWAIPADARLEPRQTEALAKLLGMEPRALGRKLAANGNFVYLQRQLDPETAGKIAELQLPGIHQETEFRRFYPAGDMAAHVVGSTNVDHNGRAGMELVLQNELTGEPGHRSVIRDRHGRIVEDIGEMRPPQDGEDIRLALDSRIQYLAFSAVRDAAREHRAQAASAVVIDAGTGEILALVNWPSYDPNKRSGLSGTALRNRAVTDSYEPGSTLKPFTVALALEKGKLRFDSIIDCAPGRLTIGNATISDIHSYGALTVAQVIQKSSNVGVAKIAAQLSAREMWEMFNLLGFGSVSALGFPGESGGRLRAWKNWRPIEQATISYGHGISVSLLQLAHAYTVFARDGDLVPLSLVARDEPPPVGIQVFSPQTAREIRAMLEMVVHPGGTATRARVPGYRVAGKSGTPYKLEGGVYTRKYMPSFVGIFPVSAPRYVVAVMVDEPSAGQHYGGAVAAPVFSRIAADVLRIRGVPPDAANLQVAGLDPDALNMNNPGAHGSSGGAQP